MVHNFSGSRKEISDALSRQPNDEITIAARAAFALLPAPVAGEADAQISVQTQRDVSSFVANVSARINLPPIAG